MWKEFTVKKCDISRRCSKGRVGKITHVIHVEELNRGHEHISLMVY